MDRVIANLGFGIASACFVLPLAHSPIEWQHVRRARSVAEHSYRVSGGERPMDDAGGRLRQHSLQPVEPDQYTECSEPARRHTYSTGIPHGHEGCPLVVGSTLYMVTPFPNNLIALDLTKPGFPQKWIFQPNPDSRVGGRSLLRHGESRRQFRRRQDHLQHAR